MTISYSHCSPSQQKQVNKFFKQHKTNASCHSQDMVYCALSNDQQIIAAAFIRILAADQPLFRSLYVAPEYRGRSIAANLSQFALEHYAFPCFTLCKQELVPFYLKLGFSHCDLMFDSKMVNEQIKKGLLLLRRP